MSERWYALLVETDSYAPGAHCLDWETQLRPELEARGFSYGLAPKQTTEWEARTYVDANRDKVKPYVGSNRRAKARAQGGRCWYCGRVMNINSVAEPDSAELEHQTPQSRNLPECYSDSNKVASCRACNNPAEDGKGNRTLEEYRAYLLKKRYPGMKHLFFYGEWLLFVDKDRQGTLHPGPLARLAHLSFLHPDRSLAFPRDLLPDALNTT